MVKCIYCVLSGRFAQELRPTERSPIQAEMQSCVRLLKHLKLRLADGLALRSVLALEKVLNYPICLSFSHRGTITVFVQSNNISHC